MKRKETREYRFETKQIHSGQKSPDPTTGARAVPIYATTSYVFENCQQAEGRFNLTDSGNIYSRLTNPTQGVFEERMAVLEGGVAALAVASGMAAITYAIQGLAKSGDHIVASKNIYGGTYNLLKYTMPEFGITTSFVEDDYQSAILENTKAIFVESLGNPNGNVADIEGLSKIAHKNGIPLIVDNTFATPFLIRPIEYGADVVVHSATKFIGGHGTAIGGVIIDGGSFDWASSNKFPGLSKPNQSYHGLCFAEAVGPAAFVTKIRATLLRDTGAALSPFHSFMLLQGLETLSLRVERQVANALQVVEYLDNHPMVARVHHPATTGDPNYAKYLPCGGCSIFSFDIKGGAKEAREFIDKLELFSLLANVADVKSLVIHPASTTHSQLSPQELKEQKISEGTIRLSIGAEHIDDILADLENAFQS